MVGEMVGNLGQGGPGEHMSSDLSTEKESVVWRAREKAFQAKRSASGSGVGNELGEQKGDQWVEEGFLWGCYRVRQLPFKLSLQHWGLWNISEVGLHKDQGHLHLFLRVGVT